MNSSDTGFIIGIVGGLGPAATVDFMEKIIRHTPAECDQDHVRMVVDSDPTIPDRTAHLLGRGPDPTPGLERACRRLQSMGASMIAIPCNTAHAFLDAIEQELAIPLVRMPDEAAAFIARSYPGTGRVGLLATTGTGGSGLYQRCLAEHGIETLTPDEDSQALVMGVIGDIKAGRIDEDRADRLAKAADALRRAGAELLILGCTELPLLSAELGRRCDLPLVDPTDVLARRCVELSGRSVV